jgi:hypothetical protein
MLCCELRLQQASAVQAGMASGRIAESVRLCMSLATEQGMRCEATGVTFG